MPSEGVGMIQPFIKCMKTDCILGTVQGPGTQGMKNSVSGLKESVGKGWCQEDMHVLGTADGIP